MAEPDPGPSPDERLERVRQVVEECMERRAAGETLTDPAVIAAHPDLLPELAEELRNLAAIEQARRQVGSGVDRRAAQAEPDGDDSKEEMPGPSPVSPGRESLFADDSARLPHADSIAGYQIIREVHRGGQGVVYQAIQKTTKRKVAIKVMREGPFAGARDKVRFEREVQILGALNHPNIVAVHDSGTASGNFYFVMDYISGQPLDVWISSGQHSIEETLRLFATICSAVNAAHLRGVIHRDLKPSNIRMDPEGQPHVLDFGLAKVATGQMTDETRPQAMTVTGQFIGSLPWASPEQAEGNTSKIDIRTDVYSLGVILYQMLTGKFPYDVIGNMRDVLDRILKAEPARPSTIRRQINDEVETIVLKCLAKERDRRYQSAGELARDIQHYLAGEPVEAKRDSTLYVLRKTLRRYKAAVAVVAGFVVLVTAAFLVSMGFWRLAVRDRDGARQARTAEQKQRERAELKSREAEEAQRRAEQETDLARRHAYAASINLAHQSLIDADTTTSLQLLFDQRPDPGPKDLRGFEWYYLWRLCHPEAQALRMPDNGVFFVGVTPGGQTLMAASNCAVAFWDVGTWQERRRILASPYAQFAKMDLSPDGKLLATMDVHGTTTVWDAGSGQELARLNNGEPAPGEQVFLSFSPDGTLLACSRGVTITIWDWRKQGRAATLTSPRPVFPLAFSPDGRTLAAGTGEWRRPSSVILWNATNWKAKPPLEGHESTVYNLRFSPAGDLLASVSDDKTVKLWDLSTNTATATFRGHEQPVYGLAFSRDGKKIASGSQDRTVRVWDIQTGRCERIFSGHGGTIFSVAFLADDGRIASAGLDGTVRIWDPSKDPRWEQRKAHQDEVRRVAFSPDGTLLASAGFDGVVKLWDVRTFREIDSITAFSQQAQTVVFSPDGRILATAGLNRDYPLNAVRLWDLRTRTKVKEFDDHLGLVLDVAFSPDGRRLASVSSDQTGVIRWLDESHKPIILNGHEDSIEHVRFTPDGRVLLTGSWDHDVGLWNAETGDLLGGLPGWDGVAGLAISPDGQTVAVSRWSGLVQLWDLHKRLVRVILKGHGGDVHAIAFSPDGSTVATGSCDQTVRMWDPMTGEMRSCFKLDTQRVWSLAFSPDGRTMATAEYEGTVRLWRAASQEEVESDPDVAVALMSREHMAFDEGKYEKSFALRREALQKHRALLGPTHRNTIGIQGNLGFSLLSTRGQKVQSEGEQLLLDLVQLARGNPLLLDYRVDALTHLGAFYADQASVKLNEIDLQLIECAPAGQLSEIAWTILAKSGKSGQEYARALRLAEAAHEKVPDDWFSREVFGVACYRTGRYEQARSILIRSDLISRGTEGMRPDDVDLIAVALKQLDQHDEARQGVSEGRHERIARFECHLGMLLMARPEPGLQSAGEQMLVELSEASKADPRLLDFRLELLGSLADFYAVHARAKLPGIETQFREIASLADLNVKAWRLIRYPGGSEPEYSRGLYLAKAAHEKEPESWAPLNTFGVAQYRVGHYEEALSTLIQSDAIERKAGPPSPDDAAFIAMALYRLNRQDEAQKWLNELRKLMAPPAPVGKEVQQILQEAEALIAPTTQPQTDHPPSSRPAESRPGAPR